MLVVTIDKKYNCPVQEGPTESTLSFVQGYITLFITVLDT